MKLFRSRPSSRLHQEAAVRAAHLALEHYKNGGYQEALEKIDHALSVLDRSAMPVQDVSLYGMCLSAKTMIVAALGRYDEARQMAKTLRGAGAAPASLIATAFAELYTGRLNDALRICNEVMAADPDSNSANGMAATIALLLGDTSYALRLLDYDSDDPTRLLLLAETHLRDRDSVAAEEALDLAEPRLPDYAVVILEYRRLRALAAAHAGDGATMEANLRLLDEAVAHARHKSWDAAIGRGEALFMIQGFDAALSAFVQASGYARHPMDIHITRYWLARAHAALRNKDQAELLYRAVLADGFRTRMSDEASSALSLGA